MSISSLSISIFIVIIYACAQMAASEAAAADHSFATWYFDESDAQMHLVDPN